LTSAADFILNLSERDLKMEPGEYQRLMQGVIISGESKPAEITDADLLEIETKPTNQL
jgi:hypothetical protein